MKIVNRNTLSSFSLLLSMLIWLLLLTRCQEEKITSVEVKALEYLINTINDSTFIQNPGNVLLPFGFKKDIESFKDGLYYANGSLCLISQLPPGLGYGRPLNRISESNIDEFLFYMDSLRQSNYSPAILPEVPGVVKMSYEEYNKAAIERSYYFTIRHHLKSGNIYLIEINLVPYSKSHNPFYYTFNIICKHDGIFIWEVWSQETFEIEIDC